jgi:glyoxalase family protein
MSERRLLGIHHVTGICGEAQTNLDFYTGALGLRLVKLTVNFDDAGAYHLYYAAGNGAPGTILTFFPYPGGREWQPGQGMVTATALAVPWGSLGWWEERLEAHGVGMCAVQERLGEQVLCLEDPHGTVLELVSPAKRPSTGPGGGTAITGLHSVTLASGNGDETGALLVDGLGLKEESSGSNRRRYRVGQGPGAFVDVAEDPLAPRGRGGTGGIHHVAFRTADRASQQRWKKALEEVGLSVSPVMNRDYFTSIYFREPGGALFEIATDGPGFGVDEPEEELGKALMLPQQFENIRHQIQERLPALRLPGGELVGS